MRKGFCVAIILLCALTLFAPMPAQAQAGTPSFFWDPGAGYMKTSFLRDSLSTTDSDFVDYTPATSEWYRGFYLTMKNGSIATFRFCKLGAENPALDSTVVTATVIGNTTIFVNQKPYPKIALVAGTRYRLQMIQTLNLPLIRVQGAIITSTQ